MTTINDVTAAIRLIDAMPPFVTQFRMGSDTVARISARLPHVVSSNVSDQLGAVPVITDDEIPDGVIRAVYSDGTTKDIPTQPDR